MQKIDLNKIKKVYFIEIEGAGTSALAQIYKKLGCEVFGSDNGDHFYRNILQKRKIKTFSCFNKKNIPQNTDLVIYSTCIKKDNPEIVEAKKRKLKIWSYPKALSYLFNQKFGIAVCGTHGKTTITAMAGFLFKKAKLKPTVLVGAYIKQFSGNALIGQSKYFIIEADEYQNKLKYYNPKIVILNNIDYDHPDFFKNLKEYKLAFRNFVSKLGKDCLVIANFDDVNVRSVVKNIKAKVISFNKKDIGEFDLKIFGEHNKMNSLPVIALGKFLKIKTEIIRSALREFSGAKRRMEKKGKFKNILIYDDYAHHPVEIKASLKALRKKYKNEKICCVFHPHSFSRTKAFLKDFAKSFEDVNKIIVLDIYGSAREKSGKIHSKDLVREINKFSNQNKVLYIPTIKKCVQFFQNKNNQKNIDIIITMGAGDVWQVGEKLINKK
ncbi:MAG: hypothetical protein GWO87_01650 [Xanthomonadaceae bacterium]|nr:hypothetical protein [Rhodospirillaceae bacterium]NIA17875.1 hypothetical protein [Xanthomonadaceae bacterium]